MGDGIIISYDMIITIICMLFLFLGIQMQVSKLTKKIDDLLNKR